MKPVSGARAVTLNAQTAARERIALAARLTALTLAALIAIVMWVSAVNAQEAERSEPAALATPITVQLNKLEDVDQSCRAYLVVNNKNDIALESVRLDLVLFRTDGVIERRFAANIAPLRASKLTVKLFDLNNVKCSDIGSLLINDVMECTSPSGPVSGCLSKLEVSSLTEASLSK